MSGTDFFWRSSPKVAETQQIKTGRFLKTILEIRNVILVAFWVPSRGLWIYSYNYPITILFRLYWVVVSPSELHRYLNPALCIWAMSRSQRPNRKTWKVCFSHKLMASDATRMDPCPNPTFWLSQSQCRLSLLYGAIILNTNDSMIHVESSEVFTFSKRCFSMFQPSAPEWNLPWKRSPGHHMQLTPYPTSR